MKKILIYNSGGGLGDSIQIFNFIVSLRKYFSKSELFYLGSHENHFNNSLKEYNLKIKNLDLNLKYFGFRIWHFFRVKNNFKKLNLEKFDLIIDLQSKIRNTIILKQIPHKFFYSSTFNFKFCSVKKKYIPDKHIKNLNKFLDSNIKEKKYEINTINKRLFSEAKKLLPKKNYIGFSITQGNLYRKKSWPLINFINLAKEILKKKKIPVFFIQDKKLINKIKSKISIALFPEINSKKKCPALVTALATRLEKVITIDNGIMHMMGLAKVPMIALFGPTNSKKFAPKYKGVKILDSKKIYKSKDINLITVRNVLKEI